MAQIAPNIGGGVAGDGGGHFNGGQPVNQSSNAEAIQNSSTSPYGPDSPVAYTAPHLYPSNVVPYGSSSLSGANVLPASSVLYPPIQSQNQSQPSTPVPTAAKRKQLDDHTPSTTPAGPSRKRRVQMDPVSVGDGAAERDDTEVGPHGGPKHWTDSEKNSLFSWLLVHDKHWDMFKTKMNTVFRDASVQIFGGRKSFTALKSCYHRNVETFKQIYAFESYLTRADPNCATGFPSFLNHPDPSTARQAYLEPRLESARAAGAPVGNLNVKVIDHWHQTGWYGLFKSRFREDPRTGIPVPYYGPLSISNPDGPPVQQLMYRSPEIDPRLANDDGEEEDDVDDADGREEALEHVNGSAGAGSKPTTMGTFNARYPSQRRPANSGPRMSGTSYLSDQSSPQAQVETIQALDRLAAVTQTLVDQCATLTELLREEAEQRRARVDAMDRNSFKREDGLNRKEKAGLATEMLANGDVGDEVRRAAADYLKRLFMSE